MTDFLCCVVKLRRILPGAGPTPSPAAVMSCYLHCLQRLCFNVSVGNPHHNAESRVPQPNPYINSKLPCSTSPARSNILTSLFQPFLTLPTHRRRRYSVCLLSTQGTYALQTRRDIAFLLSPPHHTPANTV